MWGGPVHWSHSVGYDKCTALSAYDLDTYIACMYMYRVTLYKNGWYFEYNFTQIVGISDLQDLRSFKLAKLLQLRYWSGHKNCTNTAVCIIYMCTLEGILLEDWHCCSNNLHNNKDIQNQVHITMKINFSPMQWKSCDELTQNVKCIAN